MGSKIGNPLFMEIAEECRKSFYKNRDMKVYQRHEKGGGGRLGRFIFHSCGHHMIHRVLKRHKIQPRGDLLAVNWWQRKKKDEVRRCVNRGSPMIECDNPYFEDFNVSLWWYDMVADKEGKWDIRQGDLE
jgi:hypothetical protein